MVGFSVIQITLKLKYLDRNVGFNNHKGSMEQIKILIFILHPDFKKRGDEMEKSVKNKESLS